MRTPEDGGHGWTFAGESRSASDRETERWLNSGAATTETQFDVLVRDAAHEVEAERLAGRLRPFREGEPVGRLPRRVRVRRPTDAQVRLARCRRMEDNRRGMLALRRLNDEVMRDLLRDFPRRREEARR